MKKNRLRQLRIKRIDLVDMGAAIEPRITLFKRREPVSKMTLAEALAAMPEETRKLVEDALAQAAASSKPQESAPQNQPPKPNPPAMQAEPEKQFPPRQEEQAMAEKPAEKPMEMSPEERERMAKSIREELKKELQAEREAEKADLQKQRDAAEAQAKADREAVAKMRDENLERECVTKAGKYPRGAAAISKSDLTQLFKSIAKKEPLSDAQAALLEKHFASVEEQLSKSPLFKEIGSSFEGESSASDQLQAIAKSLKEKTPDLSEVEALSKAYELNPSLYAKAREEERARS